MIKNISEGIVVTDRNCRALVMNSAAKKALGLDEQMNAGIVDLTTCLHGKLDIKNKLEESLKSNKTIETPEVLLGDHSFEVLVAPAVDSGTKDENVLGGIVVFHDITHDKEISKSREEDIVMMVHELRSPLSGINALVDFMKDEPEQTAEKYFESMRAIQECSSRMIELINTFLDVAKLEAGRFEMHAAPSDISKLIEDRVRFFSSSAREAGVTLEARLDKSVPASTTFDSKLITQAIDNLVSNALKFTPAGGKVVLQAILHRKGESIVKEIESAGIKWFLSLDDKNILNLPDSVVVAVTDSGIGISPDNIHNLFKKFRQFSTALSGKKGTGLGLALVKELVAAHNGVVGVGSKEGVGSTFYFTIPLVTD